MNSLDESITLIIVGGFVCSIVILATAFAANLTGFQLGFYKLLFASYVTTAIFLFELEAHDRLSMDGVGQYRDVIWYVLLLIPVGFVSYYYGLVWTPSVLIIAIYPTELIANYVSQSLDRV